MCNPAAAALVVTVIAGGYAAVQQRRMGQYQEDVAEENAKVAKLQAENAKQAGNVEEERARARVRMLMGQQRAAMAANNVDLSTGSPLDILGDTAGQGYADAALIRSNAVREAWGFDVGAQNERQRGKAARWNGNAQATGTLLSTGAQAAGMWGQSGFGMGSSARASSPSAYGPYASGYRYPGGG